MRDSRTNTGFSPSAQPRVNILVQVDQYLNSAATVVTLSPHLRLILDSPYLHHATPAHQTDDQCARCHEQLETFLLYGQVGGALRCRCLLIVFDEPLTLAQVMPCWASFLQLQSRILARLAMPERN